MHKRVYKQNIFVSLLISLSPLVFTAAVITALLFGFGEADKATRSEGTRLLEEALSRAVVHNYAVKGYYPESLSYITENYNIYIDPSRYTVHYDVFVSNVLPNIVIYEID